jgi:UDP-N-acetyl-D-glucosamine dehydrogenase
MPHSASLSHAASLLEKFGSRSAVVGIVGLGYVGLPLAMTIARSGFVVLGFDKDPVKTDSINAGTSYIKHIGSADIAEVVRLGRLRGERDPSRLGDVDVVILCLPTPLTPQREPDLSFVTQSTELVARSLRPGQLIVLESTTYPGTTADVLRPILERSGLKSGNDFFLAYSPEREDPGNPRHSTSFIPKVVGGDGPEALRLACAFYDTVVVRTVPVSSLGAAEAVKVTENIFRSVNVALVNELKIVFDAMGIDVWEVIEAAKSKPFGFMPFYPGPGLGGHCVPIDPFYLTWKAREFGVATRFVELAGQINTAMPLWVVNKTIDALNNHSKALRQATVIVCGVAYKKNVDDTRESPALAIMRLLEKRGAQVLFHDPFVPVIPRTREYGSFYGRKSVPLTRELVSRCDAAIICTDHDDVDYRQLVEWSQLVIDTRNVCGRLGVKSAKLVRA